MAFAPHPRKALTALFFTLLTYSTLLQWPTTVSAGSDGPSIAVYNHETEPINLSFFRGSDVLLFHDIEMKNVYRSKDAGISWEQIKAVPDHVISLLVMHEFDDKIAYALSEGTGHFITYDRGEVWSEFSSIHDTTIFRYGDILHFHADDPSRVIFHGMLCEGMLCSELTTYTTDNFKTVHELRVNTDGCWWAKSSKQFTTATRNDDGTPSDKDSFDVNRTICILRDRSNQQQKQRLVISDDFFQKADGGNIQEFEPNLDTNRGVLGVVNIATVNKYLLAATTSVNTDEMAIYITDDTKTWHRAMFPAEHGHTIRKKGFTVLESTDYSIQIDVMFTHEMNPMGALFTSNSNGTYFTENLDYTNRNRDGNVDFEKITGVQGIFLVNFVENGADVEKNPRTLKKIVSKITFDDGREFEPITVGDDRIHLHSVTELDNVGKVFSSPAPGLVMGVGNSGDSLQSWGNANLYVSEDAGLTWKLGLKGPHKYEFGDQGSILVAVKDSNHEDVSEISYSLNHGDDWKTVSFPEGLKIEPRVLTTTQQSASLKFILQGRANNKHQIIAIDFEGLQEKTCADGDMVDWHARVDHDKNPTCVMGHKQTYTRRKKDADCFIKKPFTEPKLKSEPCECAEVDFECDYNFARDEKRDCKPAKPIKAPQGACSNPEDSFQGPSGWRKIPGNQCKGGVDKEKKIEWKCKDAAAGQPDKPATDKPEHEQNVLASGYPSIHKYYLERGDTSVSDDETVIARAYRLASDGETYELDRTIWRTADHGKKWSKILEKESITDIIPHQYFKDVVFFTTRDSKRVIYTLDRGEHFHEFEAKLDSSLDHTDRNGPPLSFHPDNKDWLIWVGEKYEKVDDRTIREAWISTSTGDVWDVLLPRSVERCEFTGSSAYNFRNIKQIICLVREFDDDRRDNPKKLIGSDDFFKTQKDLVKNVKGFAIMSEFIVVAAEGPNDDGLQALTSLDGVNFQPAHFPINSKVSHRNAYTVLDSSTHAVSLFLATEKTEGHEYGNLVKSNSNGTSYVRMAEAVNCNEDFYVDFERVTGVDGVILINTVANKDELNKDKILQTKITHNDGAEWTFLPPPAKDKDSKRYECQSSGDAKCALHLHHYTERDDKKRTFSAESAVGIMFGVGNVGASLGAVKDADTFLTTDAGLTWKNVAKGAWTWAFGDQGSLLVLVQKTTSFNKAKTNSVQFSIDEGDSWQEFVFGDKEVEVMDITSVRSGASRNFLLWVRNGEDISAVNLDFAGVYERGACTNPKEDDRDYYVWSPRHPLQDDDCFFGHVSQFYRKNKGEKCYNDYNLDHLYQTSNCQCSRRDFECAYNFEMDNTGQCSLVPGHEPLSAQEWCTSHPNASTWYEPTGYRKLPLSTCAGGNEMDKSSSMHACAGHEEEFEDEHRTSGFAVFLAVVAPFVIAGGAGWWVWRHWDGKFGQIRLGEPAFGSQDQSPWVKYPVIAISALVAIVAATPLVAMSIWRGATSTYERIRGGGRSGGRWSDLGGSRTFTTRDSFARGRGDYATVDEDEGELLGDESEDEV